MAQGRLILITGGARSGKSRLAEELAEKMVSERGGRVVYVATAEALDEEMAWRIALHRQRRPGDWETVEESQAVEKVIQEQGQKNGVIVLDCLALLLSNWLHRWQMEKQNPQESESPARELKPQEAEEALLLRMRALAEAARESVSDVIVVTNEVGMGLVPDNPLGRIYRDLLGKFNQAVAARADEVYLVCAGIPLRIKP